MARMYSRKRGRSGSTRPLSKKPPSWCKYAPEEVEAMVTKLAKEGLSSSMIGGVMRDRHGVPLVKPLVGKKVTSIMKSAKLHPNLPEDLGYLLRKAERLKRHLERNKADSTNKRALNLIEAKIHNLSKYYKRRKVIPEDWKYKTAVAAVT